MFTNDMIDTSFPSGWDLSELPGPRACIPAVRRSDSPAKNCLVSGLNNPSFSELQSHFDDTRFGGFWNACVFD
jgi:hypothetical protein